ncbi:hypothetical protein C7M84_020168 [Penaeus vannamei]|uniref:Uncharacterized protein n=1 Tax=Penaeus vannamei TaxID=6689 RepID=A0A3R7PD66_PENVA|nr:hypothetical protein C7M84_020168 [Penaeus vannamei]
MEIRREDVREKWRKIRLISHNPFSKPKPFPRTPFHIPTLFPLPPPPPPPQPRPSLSQHRPHSIPGACPLFSTPTPRTRHPIPAHSHDTDLPPPLSSSVLYRPENSPLNPPLSPHPPPQPPLLLRWPSATPSTAQTPRARSRSLLSPSLAPSTALFFKCPVVPTSSPPLPQPTSGSQPSPQLSLLSRSSLVDPASFLLLSPHNPLIPRPSPRLLSYSPTALPPPHPPPAPPPSSSSPITPLGCIAPPVSETNTTTPSPSLLLLPKPQTHSTSLRACPPRPPPLYQHRRRPAHSLPYDRTYPPFTLALLLLNIPTSPKPHSQRLPPPFAPSSSTPSKPPYPSSPNPKTLETAAHRPYLRLRSVAPLSITPNPASHPHSPPQFKVVKISKTLYIGA